MSNFTMTRFDPEPEKRTWQGGNFAVKRDGVTVALFIFDYPENPAQLYGNEESALASAKSFMAIDDLVNASKIALTYIATVCANTPNPKKRENFAKAASIIVAALEKAGIK